MICFRCNAFTEPSTTWRLGDGASYEVCRSCDQEYGGDCPNCGIRTNTRHFISIGRRADQSYIQGCQNCVGYCSRCERRELIINLQAEPVRRRRAVPIPADDPLSDEVEFQDDVEEDARIRLYCPECWRTSRTIRSHNFNPMDILSFVGNPKKGLYFGVELEVEAPEDQPAIAIAEQITSNHSNFVVCKHDGSLRNGFEVVTCPASLEEQRRFWGAYFDADYPLESYNSSRCSMHVHMSRMAIAPMQLARMMVFIYSEKMRVLVETIAGRTLSSGWGERYAEINTRTRITDIVGVRGGRADAARDVDIFANVRNTRRNVPALTLQQIAQINEFTLPPALRSVYKKRFNDNRYTAFNDTNAQTVELRIFRGCNRRTTVFKNLEFCQALVDYCRVGTTSFANLEDPFSFGMFVVKNSGDYPYLKKFMDSRGLLPTS